MITKGKGAPIELRSIARPRKLQIVLKTRRKRGPDMVHRSRLSSDRKGVEETISKRVLGFL